MDHPFRIDLRWPESSAPDVDRFEVRRGIGWISNPVLYAGPASRCELMANLGTETYGIRAYNRSGRWSPTVRRVYVTKATPGGWTAAAGDLPRDERAEGWPGTMTDVVVASAPDLVESSLGIAAEKFVGTYVTDALDAGSIQKWTWSVAFDMFQWVLSVPPNDGLDSGLGDDWTGEGLAPSPLALGAELEPTDWPWPIEQYPHPLRAPSGVLGRHTLGIVESRFSDDAIAWSEWEEWWTPATRNGRYVQVRVTLRRRAHLEHDLRLLDLRVDAAAAPTSSGGAPDSAEYLVGAASGGLSAERVVTDTTTVAWDLATPAQAKANVPEAGAATKGVVQLAGDLTGTAASPALVDIGAATGPLGGATVAPIVTIDAKGRVTALSSATITGVAPAAHAASHKHGGSDQVATATPGANEIPKADGSGKLDAGWIPSSIATDAEVSAGDVATEAAANAYTDDAIATHAGLADPHTGYQKESEKDGASGYAGLNAASRVIRPVLSLYDGVSTDLPILAIAEGQILGRLSNQIISVPTSSWISNTPAQIIADHFTDDAILATRVFSSS